MVFRHTVTVRVWRRNTAGWVGHGLAECAGRVRSLLVWGRRGKDFSKSCSCGTGLNFAGRKRIKISTRTGL